MSRFRNRPSRARVAGIDALKARLDRIEELIENQLGDDWIEDGCYMLHFADPTEDKMVMLYVGENADGLIEALRAHVDSKGANS